MAEQIFLARDVFFCVAQGQGVFLDLRRDEYSAVPLSQLPVTSRAVSERDLHHQLRAFEPDLRHEHLIADEGNAGAPLTTWLHLTIPAEPAIPSHDDRLFGLLGEDAVSTRIGLGDWFDFFGAARRASMLLKRSHIRDVVHGVRARRIAAEVQPKGHDAITRQALIFAKLRPWYPRPYLCLLDALMLVEFLACRKCFPVWMFGVQAQPFGAHCWVQQGDRVVNESVEYARQFTPIMSV